VQSARIQIIRRLCTGFAFLVGIRCAWELSRAGYAIAYLQNSVMAVDRDENGQLHRALRSRQSARLKPVHGLVHVYRSWIAASNARSSSNLRQQVEPPCCGPCARYRQRLPGYSRNKARNLIKAPAAQDRTFQLLLRRTTPHECKSPPLFFFFFFFFFLYLVAGDHFNLPGL